ncbi:hypothetical protein Leryth_017883 [Lithospermum erythrorhizon]|nr:hypothetical protein Leryth_017883 [Lithospermum erythrorhizon]
MAEFIGTFFLIFAGCASVVVHVTMDKVVTLPGIAITWGMVVMVMIYSLGHISGAHFNPAVTIAFASCNKFPWKQVPAYVMVQILASTLASEALRLIFEGKQDVFLTLPSGSNMQSLVLEFITTFFLMFVIAAIATSDQAIKEISGIAIGATVLMVYSQGASMNPARSLGPAIISGNYKGLWIYMVGPISRALAGAWVYKFTRPTYKPNKIFNDQRENMEVVTASSEQAHIRLTMDEGMQIGCNCGEGWTCFFSKTEPSKAGKAYYRCGGTCSCVMVVAGVINQESSSISSPLLCKCDEGWSCTISKTDGLQASKDLFECGEGCMCMIDENNIVRLCYLSNGLVDEIQGILTMVVAWSVIKVIKANKTTNRRATIQTFQ